MKYSIEEVEHLLDVFCDNTNEDYEKLKANSFVCWLKSMESKGKIKELLGSMKKENK